MLLFKTLFSGIFVGCVSLLVSSNNSLFPFFLRRRDASFSRLVVIILRLVVQLIVIRLDRLVIILRLVAIILRLVVQSFTIRLNRPVVLILRCVVHFIAHFDLAHKNIRSPSLAACSSRFSQPTTPHRQRHASG